MKTLSRITLLLFAAAVFTYCSKDDNTSSDHNSGGSTTTDDDFVTNVTNNWVDENDATHSFFFQNSDTLGGFAGQENSSGNFLLGTMKGFNFTFTLITQNFATIKYTGYFTDTTIHPLDHRRLLLYDPDSIPLYLRPQ